MEAINSYSMSFDEEEKQYHRAQFIGELKTMSGQEIMGLINAINWTPSIEVFRPLIYNLLYDRLTRNYFRIIPAQYVEISSEPFAEGYTLSSELSEDVKEFMWGSVIEGSSKFQTVEPEIVALITSLQIIND